MAKKFLSTLKIVNLPSDPISGSEGELYFDTSASVAKIYQAGAWSVLGAGGGGTTVSTTEPDSPEIGDSWYKNDTGELYIYDGTYWVEVNGTISAAGDLENIDSITYPDYITFDTTPETSSSEVGTLSWNETDGTLDVKLTSDVTLQVGQEQHVRVYNGTGSTITNGTVVYVNGASDIHGHISIAPYIADGSVNVFNVMGLATADILDGEDGYVTLSGLVRGLDTSDFTAGQYIFASDTVAGGLTTTQPISPSETVSLGVVTVSDETNGTIFVQIDTGATADLVTYNHIHSLLEATNVAAALDELAYTKADINSIATNLVLYPTSASVSGISGYYKMAETIDDPDYNDTAVNIPTGDLNGTGTGHLIAELAANPGIFVGSPGSINITTIGNIRKTGGNANAYSEFFFKVFHRDSGGTETLVGTSSTTGAVNPTILNNYAQFSAAGNFLLNAFSETDILVIKYYSNVINTGSQTYEFQFGGDQPVRTLVPVPISVTPASNASGTLVNTSTFNGVLSGADSTVQNALETIDDIITIPDQTGHDGEFLTTTGTSLGWVDPGYLTIESASSAYLTQFDAGLLYQPLDERLSNIVDLEPAEGFVITSGSNGFAIDSNEYLTTANASSTYLNIYDAEVQYLSVESASTIYQPLSEDLTDISSLRSGVYPGSGLVKFDGEGWVWDTSTYLTTETDPVFLASEAYYITSTDTLNWDTSYGWGNHASAGYALSSHGHSLDGLSDVYISDVSDGQSIVWSSASSKWINALPEGGSSVVISSTAPSSPAEGDLWFDSDTLELFIFDSVYWIEVSGGAVDLSSYLTISSASSTYLTIESDTLETVTDRGATSSNAITISNTTQATDSTSGALIVSGGMGVAKDVWIDGNLHVNGTTTTENTKTVATHDNLIYLNAAIDTTITNAVYASGSITYTAENTYTAGMDIRVTGVDPSGFNISTGDNLTVASATPTQFIVVKSDPGASYVSGGTAHAKEEANPDLGFAGGYYDSGYAHAGLFRDSSDGIFKFFKGYTPEPDEAVNIDTGHSSFELASVSAGSLMLTYALMPQHGGTGLSSLGTAGQVLKVNSTESALEWGTVDALPSQSGNNGKYLTTDGSIASWATLDLSLYAPLNSPTLITPNIGEATGTSLKTTGNVIGHIDRFSPAFSANATTLDAAHDGGLLLLDNSSTAGTLYIPTDATYSFPKGTQILLTQTGAGQITIAAADSGVTTVNCTPGNKLRAQWSSATLIKTTNNTWLLIGDLAA